jgi:hypothetical protein
VSSQDFISKIIVFYRQISHQLQCVIYATQGELTSIGLPLRGRYLWSSRYAQIILAQAIECYFNSTEEYSWMTELQKHVTEIERQAIKELISSLKELGNKNRRIYSCICRLTIRADALNKPTLFPDDCTGKMVTLGFAYAHCDPGSSDWKEGFVKIGEPLAIRAVLQYLESDEEGKMEFTRQADEMVYANQDNPSSLGFSAEYFLATVSSTVMSLLFTRYTINVTKYAVEFRCGI